MIIEADVFSIDPHFITAIEYGDYSGLTDQDIKKLESFLANLPTGVKYWQYSDDKKFCKCDITRLMADCVEAKLSMNHSDL